MTVRVITASKHGSTAEIGDAIAARLRDNGHDAVAEDAASAGSPPAGDAVVIGSPLYMGKWMKPARAVLDELAAEPPGRRVFVFTVGPLGDPPQPADAGPEDEVQAFADRRAVAQRVFSGALDRAKLSRWERIAIKAVKAPDGDYRDWDAINGWADEIAVQLGAPPLRPPTSPELDPRPEAGSPRR